MWYDQGPCLVNRTLPVWYRQRLLTLGREALCCSQHPMRSASDIEEISPVYHTSTSYYHPRYSLSKKRLSKQHAQLSNDLIHPKRHPMHRHHTLLPVLPHRHPPPPHQERTRHLIPLGIPNRHILRAPALPLALKRPPSPRLRQLDQRPPLHLVVPHRGA